MTYARKLTLAAAAAVGLSAALAPAANAAPSTDSLGPPPADCEVDTAALAEETPAPEGMDDFPGWTVGDTSDPCGNLGYVVLDTEGGTGSSPNTIVLFHRGETVPTQPEGTEPAEVTGHSDFHVVVETHGEPADGVSNAEAPTTSTAYVWNPLESDVVPVDVPDFLAG